MKLALDKSARSRDENGYLHVESSHISKACVNPYYGREIPGWQDLGLDPDTLYQVLRPAEELEKAASTFHRLPILSEHIPIDAADYAERARECTIGTTGDGATFSDPYLDSSLTVWDAQYIDSIEDETQKEISCAYRYEPVLEFGEFEGKPYTLIMKNLRGNHVAIVKEGRAGSDVMVSDSKPKPLITMKFLQVLKKALGIAMDAKNPNAKSVQKVLLGMDGEADPEQTENALLDAMKDINAQETASEGSEPEPDKVGTDEGDFLTALKAFIEKFESGQQPADPMVGAGAAGDEGSDGDGAEAGRMDNASENTDDDGQTPPAMDAKAVRMQVRREIQAEITAKARAAQKVHPLVGSIDAMGFDSVPDIYRFALESHGFETKGVPASSYEGMVTVLLSSGKNHAVVQDSKSGDSILDVFPNLKSIKRR